MESATGSRNEYDVFLSFRGLDTRQTFTDCLYEVMKGTGVRVFRDDDEIQGGKNIKDELWQAIESSKIYMPVFSKTYASSKWCLKELAKMIEITSRSNGTKEILPIFFDVSPGDVKLKTSLYKNELSNHAKMYEADKVKAWEKALMEVGKLKGWKPRNLGHGRLITSVVEDVLIKLNNRNKILTKHLVEDRKQVDAVMELLDINSGGTHSVGIRGIGGIGKTTLAKVIFNKLSPHFDCSSFLENVREISRRSDGLVYLQKKLLSSIHRSRNNELYDVDCGIDMIRRQLSNKKVLIVVDDMEEKDLLEKLVGECDGLKSGSRVIITTRNLSAIRNEPKTILDYEVKEMESDQSLQLFCRHAFGKDFPPGDYESLAREIVSTLGNLPLAVEVIGSSLSCKHDNRALWIEVLEKLRKAPLGKVRESLMISYEELEKEQKQVFLDIACLFVQEDKTYPIFMWSDCNYYPNYAIDVLLHRSPIKVESDSKFRMNDQVRDLGRHIVQEGDCKYPSKFSRVWTHEDALNILRSKQGNEHVEALKVRGHTFTDEELLNLPNLRFLRGTGLNFVGNFKDLLPMLRWLSWHHCPPEFTATNFCPINLVVLDLSSSDITEKWDGKKAESFRLEKLQMLNKDTDLSNFVELEILILAGCSRLITLIAPLILDLSCTRISGLPATITYPSHLEELRVQDCRDLTGEIPDAIGELSRLRILDFSGTRISGLPATISYLPCLKELMLKECRELRLVPQLPSSLISLILEANHCEIIPDLSNLVTLDHLDLSFHRYKLKAPYQLEELLSPWKIVESIHQLPSSLSTLHLTDIPPPQQFSNFMNLSSLSISSCSMAHLPELEHLKKLRELSIKVCPSLERIPDLSCLKSLETLYLSELGSLVAIQGLEELESLESLQIICCESLEGLPQLSKLVKLKSFELHDCQVLQAIEGLGCLQRLKHLTILGCVSLKRLPDYPRFTKLDTDWKEPETSSAD
ncbi:disease resistance protein RUN1-like [Eucalyptus grandis]|uniref:disease resistance protein RUN1-like n=1 Tax=Eucalyptus grandis TaxID=71139 RepID=UPI00192EDDC9|nr:disease resistance protein RUN1-like [Eucalyptus grandis]